MKQIEFPKITHKDYLKMNKNILKGVSNIDLESEAGRILLSAISEISRLTNKSFDVIYQEMCDLDQKQTEKDLIQKIQHEIHAKIIELQALTKKQVDNIAIVTTEAIVPSTPDLITGVEISFKKEPKVDIKSIRINVEVLFTYDEAKNEGHVYIKGSEQRGPYIDISEKIDFNESQLLKNTSAKQEAFLKVKYGIVRNSLINSFSILVNKIINPRIK